MGAVSVILLSARLDARPPLRKADFDFEVLEFLDYRGHFDHRPVIVATGCMAHFHIDRIRAPILTRTWRVLCSLAAADTLGQLAVSKNCKSVTGMKRVRDA